MGANETYEFFSTVEDTMDRALQISNVWIPRQHIVPLNKHLELVETGDMLHFMLIGWVARKAGFIKEGQHEL